MKDLYIYHHLGMGDGILCNGLVRHFKEEYDRVFVFSKTNNAKNMLYMYRDNPNIRIIPFKNDVGVKQFMQISPDNEYKIVGHSQEYFRRLDKDQEYTFEEGFYKLAGVPFEYKWDKFYFEIDCEAEKEAFDSLGLEPGSYQLIHDDPTRGRKFREEYLNPNLKRIYTRNLLDINIFNFTDIMEKAGEVHLHNSSFANLVDTMKMNIEKLYYHKYARTDMGPNGDQTFSNEVNWKFLD